MALAIVLTNAKLRKKPTDSGEQYRLNDFYGMQQ